MASVYEKIPHLSGLWSTALSTLLYEISYPEVPGVLGIARRYLLTETLISAAAAHARRRQRGAGVYRDGHEAARDRAAYAEAADAARAGRDTEGRGVVVDGRGIVRTTCFVNTALAVFSLCRAHESPLPARRAAAERLSYSS